MKLSVLNAILGLGMTIPKTPYPQLTEAPQPLLDLRRPQNTATRTKTMHVTAYRLSNRSGRIAG